MPLADTNSVKPHISWASSLIDLR